MSNALEQAQARIAELEARLSSKSKVSYKVSRKGGISIYGLGRFPVTLYLSQFEALAAAIPAIAEWASKDPVTVHKDEDGTEVRAKLTRQG